MHNLCNTEFSSLANPIRGSSLAGKSGTDTSQTVGINAHSCKSDNQPKLIKMDPVANLLEKAFSMIIMHAAVSKIISLS